MGKDQTIIEFIKRFSQIVDINLIQIVDYWDADLCATGLRKGNKLVYISTYKYVSLNINNYDYDLECIDESDEYKSSLLKKGRNVSETDLIIEIRDFLEI